MSALVFMRDLMLFHACGMAHVWFDGQQSQPHHLSSRSGHFPAAQTAVACNHSNPKGSLMMPISTSYFFGMPVQQACTLNRGYVQRVFVIAFLKFLEIRGPSSRAVMSLHSAMGSSGSLTLGASIHCSDEVI